MPASWLFQNSLWNGISVAACWVTAYCSAVSDFLRSESLGFLKLASRVAALPAVVLAVACAPAMSGAAARARRAASLYEVVDMVRLSVVRMFTVYTPETADRFSDGTGQN